MPREIDEKQTRKALRRLARAKRAAKQADGDNAQLSEWEDEFLGSLEERLEEFGSAFNDPEKGDLDSALSARQSLKLKEIEKKAKGKARRPMSRGKGFSKKSQGFKSRSRDINEDVDEPQVPVEQEELTREARPRPNGFSPRIIDGGKS